MMENSLQLSSRFREVLLSGEWVANTNFQELLTDLAMEQATKEVGTLNTIAALTFHINYYIKGVLNVFEGGKLEIRDKFSFDCPIIQTQDEWSSMRNDLFRNALKFAQHVEVLTDQQLDDDFVDKKYGSYRRNIEAMIEHAYYHMGQVSLIKKLVMEQV